MKKIALGLTAILVLGMALVSCAKKQEEIVFDKNEPLVRLEVTGAKASSFDNTPDWAPLPDPMAPFDVDMLTRWSPLLGKDNEWLYMDFGKPKVLNKIIIRWERAYATEYEILTSDDANKWTRLLLKKDGKGNIEELAFPAVRTRYLKIIGIKRSNPEWGFSMWEFEPYGPQSLNPGEKVVTADEKKEAQEKDELAEAIEKAKAPLTPLKLEDFQKGICYTSWMDDELSGRASDKTLVYLKNLGVNVVAIVIPTYQDKIDSEVIFTNDKPGGDTPNDEALKHAIDLCHKLGMKVLIKPHVDPRDNTPRVDIIASDKWFESYEKMILRYAKIAEETKCEIFAVGTELEGTTFSRWESKWRGVITKVKEVYKGYMVYAANWTEYKSVPFWDMMDFIGIDAYFPLTTETDPSMEKLVAAWSAVADDMQKWLDEKGYKKPIVFTEAGYPSSDGANKQPWSQITDVEDQAEQKDCLEALFSALVQRPYFKGVYLWQYLPQDRWSPLGFTVKGKQAEKVLAEWYKKIK